MSKSRPDKRLPADSGDQQGVSKGDAPSGEPAPASRTGRMSTDDHDFIHRNAGKLSAEEIARQLGRRKEAVERVLRDLAKRKVVHRPVASVESEASHKEEVRAIQAELKESEAWRRIKEEFTEDELRFFREQYTALMTQFKNNVLPSESLQIFDVCTFEVLKGRNLSVRKQLREEIAEMEAEREEAKESPDPEARKGLNSLRNRINDARKNEREYTVEFATLQQRSEALMKSLKSIRDQRLREVEDGAESVTALIKRLQNEEIQQREARMTELMRLAARKEMERLGSLHEYADGSVDRPILSADTVDGVNDIPLSPPEMDS